MGKRIQALWANATMLSVAFSTLIQSHAFGAPQGLLPPAPPPPTPFTGFGNNFSSIALNITTSIEYLPGFLTGIAYLLAILLGTKGIIALKEHVEAPLQTPIHAAAIRFVVGGALLALPIIFEAMATTVTGDGSSAGVVAASLNQIEFNVN